MIATLVIHI